MATRVRARKHIIQRPRLDEDVVPFTEYRRTLNACFARTSRTHRPLVITQNGHATSVVINIADFESTWDEIERYREREELSRAIAISRREFEEGKFVTEDEVFDEMETMLDEMQARGECKRTWTDTHSRN